MRSDTFMRNQKILAVALAAIAFVTIGASFAVDIPPSPTAFSFDERREFWEKRIADIGGERAYRELAASVANLPTLTQHHESHAFGNALYAVEGLRSVSVCDNRFVYGCFHAFAIKGIVNEGVESIHAMNTACHAVLGKSVHQCQHGIGHGILATIGYSLDDLKETLRLCGTLENSDSLYGCNGGALMEYSLHGMLEENAPPPILRDDRDAVEPCTRLTEPYLTPCAYWQNQWWVAARSSDDKRELARDMGRWCTLLPGGEAALEACIMGVANKMQYLTDEDASKTHAICSLVSTNARHRYVCQKESAGRFLYYHPLSTALQACAGLSTNEERECRLATERRAESTNLGADVFHE